MFKDIVDYDAGRHSLVVDIYKPWKLVSEVLKREVYAFAAKIHTWVSERYIRFFDVGRNE